MTKANNTINEHSPVPPVPEESKAVQAILRRLDAGEPLPPEVKIYKLDDSKTEPTSADLFAKKV